MYLTSDYNYILPKELIAQNPLEVRHSSKMMILNRRNNDVEHSVFNELENLIEPGSIMVLNNTKVFNARLIGEKETGGKVEVFLLRYPEIRGKGIACARCLLKASKRPKKETILSFQNREISARVLRLYDNGQADIEIRWNNNDDLSLVLSKAGHVPLPPYIKRDTKDNTNALDLKRYQTVYAEQPGAVAAPTAGLHFTKGLLERLEKKGMEICFLTLHVGLGTFKPVTVKDLRDHRIHSEWCDIPGETALKINSAIDDLRPVIAVGTTCIRALEYFADINGRVKPGSGVCDLFIYPGFEFKIVNQIITNFHLPMSSLLMLISAFAGKDKIFNAYKEAITKKYRFYSYGDCMWIK